MLGKIIEQDREVGVVDQPIVVEIAIRKCSRQREVIEQRSEVRVVHRSIVIRIPRKRKEIEAETLRERIARSVSEA